jgi:hypothetical protein
LHPFVIVETNEVINGLTGFLKGRSTNMVVIDFYSAFDTNSIATRCLALKQALPKNQGKSMMIVTCRHLTKLIV